MARSVAYLLSFPGPLRLGGRGFQREAAADTLHSDVLFAALVWAVRRLQGPQGAADWVAPFVSGNPPLLLTSGAPYLRTRDGQPLLLYPRPVGWPEGDGGPEEKARRRALWTSPGALRAPAAARALHGVLLTEEEARLVPEGPWWVETLKARVALDRTSQASNLYFVRHRYFRPDSGLWFAVHYRDEAWRPLLEAALRVLAEEGIGGERSRGAGRFRLAGTLEAPSPGPEGAGPCWTLSLWCPAPEEFPLLKEARYHLLERVGWVCSPDIPRVVRSRRVQMVREGALLPRGGLLGRLVEVTPSLPGGVPRPHPVYRYGYAYPVPLGGGP